MLQFYVRISWENTLERKLIVEGKKRERERERERK